MSGATALAQVASAAAAHPERETRIRRALAETARDRTLPTLPVVTEVLDAPLRAGAAYSVAGFAEDPTVGATSLVMAMMAGPSGEGAWCGVVGVPTFGAEAARGLGVDLERLVLVPDPDRDWLSVVAALVDALTVVVVRPPGRVTPGEASRLAARLRSRTAMLVVLGSWPGSEARLSVEESTWEGVGDGHGHLQAHRLAVTVTGRGAATRRHDLWLPAPDGTIRSFDAAEPLRVSKSLRPKNGGAGPALLRTQDPASEQLELDEAPWLTEAVG